MLVLTRGENESIFIGGREIKITVLKIMGGSRVRIGILAPPGVSINRAEVQARLEQEADNHDT